MNATLSNIMMSSTTLVTSFIYNNSINISIMHAKIVKYQLYPQSHVCTHSIYIDNEHFDDVKLSTKFQNTQPLNSSDLFILQQITTDVFIGHRTRGGKIGRNGLFEAMLQGLSGLSLRIFL